MKASKTLTSALVAAAIVGGIGLAYAQTQDPAQTTPAPAAATQNSGSSMPGADATTQNQPATTMQNQPAMDTSTAPASTRNSSGFTKERPAQADRN